MKTRFNILSVIVLVLVLMVSCNKDQNFSTLNGKPQISKSLAGYEATRLKFKHGGCKPACPCILPLGICIEVPFVHLDNIDVLLTPLEVSEGFGKAEVNLLNDSTLHLVYHNNAAISDGTVPIDDDFFIGTEISNLFGKDSIIIKERSYQVNFDNYPTFGETYFDVITN